MIYLGVLLSWIGVALTWLSGLAGDAQYERVWLAGIGLVFLGAAISLGAGLWEHNLRPMIGHVIPVGLAVVFLLLYLNAFDSPRCEVGSSLVQTLATRFDKPCSEITLADVYEGAGVPIGGEYHYWGDEDIPDLFEGVCIIGKQEVTALNEAARLDKPCSEITLADVYEDAGVALGEEYHYWGNEDIPDLFEGVCIVGMQDVIALDDATYFEKPCSEITLAHIYWNAGIPVEGSFTHWGNGHIIDPAGGCVVGDKAYSLNATEELAHFAKPCSALTDSDTAAAGILPGQNFYYWDWYTEFDPR